MISAGDFRNGITFELDGNVVQVIEFQHVKPGKGAAFVRTKYKNVMTGAVVERSFNPTDKYPTAYIERKDMQYLYQDGDLYYFMDMETYEQLPIDKSKLGDAFRFVKENMEVKVLSYKGEVFGVEPPNFVELVVTETDPGFKVILPQTQLSRQYWKLVQRSRYRSLLTKAKRSASTPEPANIWSAHK